MSSTSLILSTLPHYFAILPWLHARKMCTEYPFVIFVSTTLSVLWHACDQPPNSLLFYADYLAATVWFLYDLKIGLYASEIRLETVFLLNALIFILNIYTGPNNIAHVMWHIVSALKCIYISNLLVPEFRRGD
jgi:hypothetical protein